MSLSFFYVYLTVYRDRREFIFASIRYIISIYYIHTHTYNIRRYVRVCMCICIKSTLFVSKYIVNCRPKVNIVILFSLLKTIFLLFFLGYFFKNLIYNIYIYIRFIKESYIMCVCVYVFILYWSINLFLKFEFMLVYIFNGNTSIIIIIYLFFNNWKNITKKLNHFILYFLKIIFWFSLFCYEFFFNSTLVYLCNIHILKSIRKSKVYSF